MKLEKRRSTAAFEQQAHRLDELAAGHSLRDSCWKRIMGALRSTPERSARLYPYLAWLKEHTQHQLITVRDAPHRALQRGKRCTDSSQADPGRDASIYVQEMCRGRADAGEVHAVSRQSVNACIATIRCRPP